METGPTLDHQSRPGLRQNKNQRDLLIRLAALHPEWVLGVGDEVRGNRLAQPPMHTWTPGEREWRLVEKSLPPADSTPQALACSGVLLRATATTQEQRWLRFATGQLVSALTCQFLSWGWDRLAALGTRALLLVGDNAAWPTSQFIHTWRRAHTRPVTRTVRGVRIVTCRLPRQSPWLNPMEPPWLPGKHAVLEPARILTAQDVAEWVCAYSKGSQEAHLSISEQAA